MKSWVRWALSAGACLLLFLSALHHVLGEQRRRVLFDVGATPPAIPGEVIDRKVLLLYDSDDSGFEELLIHPIHRAAAMPLNHLGCTVHYHDLAKGVPTEVDMEGVRGLVTWLLDDSLKNAATYCHWLRDQVDEGVRVVVFGVLGATVEGRDGKPVDPDLVAGVWESMGLVVQPDLIDRPLKIRVVDKNSDVCEFERDLKGELPMIQTARAIDPEAKVYLRLARTDRPGVTSDAVVTTAAGAWVMPGYFLHQDFKVGSNQWRVDPFRIYTEGLGLQGLPVPDPTTQNGRRLWFSHIDGDGFVNESWKKNEIWSSEVVLEGILKRFKLPVTASLVTCRQDEEALGNERSRDLAREVLALPYIEAASHGHAHPSDWRKQELTLKDVPGAETYSAEKEIRYSTTFINHHLCPRGKKVEVFLWTGACNPGKAELDLCGQLGILNINGGDGRIDGWIPSYSGASPWCAPSVGSKIRQVYSGMANENILTNEFDDPLYGFLNILQSVRNTEKPDVLWTRRGRPRRVAPINIYYHWYIADHVGSWQSIVKAVEGSTQGEIAPVFASEWARKVNGFLTTRISRSTNDGWVVEDYGSNRTIRFDDSTGVVDLARSHNVLGWRRQDHRLWVHLKPGEQAVIVPAAEPVAGKPWLHSAEHDVTAWNLTETTVEFSTSGFNDGVIEFGGLGEGDWEVAAGDSVVPVEVDEEVARVVVPAGDWVLRPAR